MSYLCARKIELSDFLAIYLKYNYLNDIITTSINIY